MDNLIKDYFESLNSDAFHGCMDKTPESGSCIECFKNQYFNNNKISYDCEEKRKLYVLRYFNVHQAENHSGLSMLPDGIINGWFEGGAVKILSIGGGPGSDVYGALNYVIDEINEREEDLDIIVSQVDAQTHWDNIFDDVMQRFFPWCLDYKKIPLDIKAGLRSIPCQDFNLVTASYLVSELSHKASMSLAVDINSLLGSGGVLMINDRSEDVVEKRICLMFDKIGMGYQKYYLTSWAGYDYPCEIADIVRPKFKMHSTVFLGVKR